jgi:hypothetical protein
MPQNSTEDLGPRGLVIYGANPDPAKFDYVNEDVWRALPSYPVGAQTGQLGSLTTLSVALARLNQSVFVDLDQLKGLEMTAGGVASQGSQPSQAGEAPIPDGQAVIVKEQGKIFVVPKEAWASAQVSISGDAGVLIERKAVLAPIPSNPLAEGTFCVLINVAALG